MCGKRSLSNAGVVTEFTRSLHRGRWYYLWSRRNFWNGLRAHRLFRKLRAEFLKPGLCLRILIAFGRPPRLDRLRTRWDKLVAIVDASAARFDAADVGVSDGGAILVRPDGFVGFCADPADDATMEALDAHLASYLIPA